MEDQAAEASYINDIVVELGYQVPAVATSLSQGLDYFSRYQPDISLVDIYLDGKPDGIVFGEELNRMEEKKPFLFLTSAVDTSTFRLAKALKPDQYLLKPFNKPELEYAMELSLERHKAESTVPPSKTGKEKPSTSVFVKRGNTLVSLQYDEIKYIEVDGKYSKLVCYNQKFVVQQPLCDLQLLLPSEQFLRVHRRFVINRKEILKIDIQSHEIFFKDGNTLFFSRRYLEDFMAAFTLIK
jgi:DNA-binding LytR/AlgR family response regulator